MYELLAVTDLGGHYGAQPGDLSDLEWPFLVNRIQRGHRWSGTGHDVAVVRDPSLSVLLMEANNSQFRGGFHHVVYGLEDNSGFGVIPFVLPLQHFARGQNKDLLPAGLINEVSLSDGPVLIATDLRASKDPDDSKLQVPLVRTIYTGRAEIYGDRKHEFVTPRSTRFNRDLVPTWRRENFESLC